MFGVFESPERTDQSEAETSSTFSPVIVESREQHRQSSSGEVRPAPEQGQSLVKVNLPAQGVIKVWRKLSRILSPILKTVNSCVGSINHKC